MSTKKRSLTVKQKKFADEYFISGNAYQSAIKAGYSKNYAKGNVVKLLENESVALYLKNKFDEMEASKFLTMEEALKITTSIARGEPRTIKESRFDSEGNRIDVDKLDYPSYNDKQKALDHFYKINGAFLERTEIDMTVKTDTGLLQELLSEMKSEGGDD